jgi:hypothetical protein
MEQLLETMYESLGALYLSRAVKQTVSLRGTARVTPQVGQRCSGACPR